MGEIDFVKILQESEFNIEPFPHWIVSNIFSNEFAEQLSNSFPSSKELHSLNYKHEVYDQNTSYLIQSDDVKNNYQDHKIIFSQWNEQRNKLIDYVSKYFPKSFVHDIEIVKTNSFARGDIRTSSPTTMKKTTQLGPHCDNPNKLLSGLIYFKNKHEESNLGGDLELYKLKKNAPEKYMSSKRRVLLKYLEKVKTISYDFNTAIFFIPSELAIHGISQREITNFDRRAINLSIGVTDNLNYSLWDIKKYSYRKFSKRKIFFINLLIKYSKRFKILSKFTKKIEKKYLAEVIYNNIDIESL